MRPIKRIFIITAILLLSIIQFYPLFGINTLNAAPSSGNTTFYFVDYIENYGMSSDYLIGTYPSISEFPPSKTNDSYYPPLIKEGFSSNPEKYLEWITFWGFSLLGQYGDYYGYDDFLDQFDDFMILLPHPLRIMESYEYDGDEAILLDGDVTFNLDFNTIKAIRNTEEDKVNISIYSMGTLVPNLLKSTITTITPPSSLSKIHGQTIVIEDVQYTLQPGSSLIFSIEIIPGNKAITASIQNKDSIFNKLSSQLIDIIVNIAEKIENPEIQDVIDFYNEFKNISSSLNFSSEDVAEFINSIVGPSLTYDSINHQSSVTVPFKSSNNTDNTITYYLDESDTLTENNPTGEAKSSSIVEGRIKWTSSVFPRSKIINSADAVLYINHKDISLFKENMEIQASLLFNNNSIASDSITLDTREFVSSTKRYHLSFDNLASGTEISYGDSISFALELKNGADSGQGLLRSVDIYYDGSEYPSYLTISLSETDHISVTHQSSPENNKIIPGDVVTYSLNISSDFDDNINIQYKNSTFSIDEKANWEIDISNPTFTIQSESKKTVNIDLKSTFISLLAYEKEPLEIDLEIIGKTGYVVIPLSAEVSEDAVIFDTIVKSSEEQSIMHGENHTYIFNITNNNTGLWPNSFIFTATSNNNWTVDIDPYTFDNLGYGNSTNVKVTLFVPKNTEIDSDILTFKVISKENGDEIIRFINSTIQGAIVLEGFFDFFESLAEDLGLDESFGEFAPFIIPIILIIAIFIIIILMVFIFTSKIIELICIDRIKEFFPHESATFAISIRNPSNKTRTYHVDAVFDNDDHKWDFTLDQKIVAISSKQSKTIQLTINPTDEINIEDWVKVTLFVATEGIKKQSKIELMAMLKNGIVDLSIQNVFHWPKYFKKDEKVTTSFKLCNKSNIQAKNIKIHLLINGKEKNKVEDIIIPARGYADISIPWIAVKGKNDISVVVT